MENRKIKAIEFLMETSLDVFDELMNDKDKAKILYAYKLLAIENEIRPSKIWYSKRNTLDWINENGKFLLDYDLGGF